MKSGTLRSSIQYQATHEAIEGLYPVLDYSKHRIKPAGPKANPFAEPFAEPAKQD